jgi:hypothetical protein
VQDHLVDGNLPTSVLFGSENLQGDFEELIQNAQCPILCIDLKNSQEIAFPCFWKAEYNHKTPGLEI